MYVLWKHHAEAMFIKTSEQKTLSRGSSTYIVYMVCVHMEIPLIRRHLSGVVMLRMEGRNTPHLWSEKWLENRIHDKSRATARKMQILLSSLTLSIQCYLLKQLNLLNCIGSTNRVLRSSPCGKWHWQNKGPSNVWKFQKFNTKFRNLLELRTLNNPQCEMKHHHPSVMRPIYE